MSDHRRIRTDDGDLTDLGEQLGRERMARFVTGHGELQAMALFLVIAVTAAPRSGYSDAALDALITDANDVRAAAARWADECTALAEAWRRQRQAEEASP
jgi:hypothetical protein